MGQAVLNDGAGDVSSHCLENFRIAAGLSAGEYPGMVFQDSDAAKWLEAVGYLPGGAGVRYKCRIQKKERFLWFKTYDEKWFIEGK